MFALSCFKFHPPFARDNTSFFHTAAENKKPHFCHSQCHCAHQWFIYFNLIAENIYTDTTISLTHFPLSLLLTYIVGIGGVQTRSEGRTYCCCWLLLLVVDGKRSIKLYNKNTFNWSSAGNYDDDRTNNQCTIKNKIKNKTIITVGEGKREAGRRFWKITLR